MGIDNNAILVYGWTFSHEEFFPKIEKLLAGFNDYIDEYNVEEIFEEHFPDSELMIGNASPYYDSDMTERTYYLSFVNLSTDKLYELMKLHKEQGFSNGLLEKMEITDPPQVYALPHIN